MSLTAIQCPVMVTPGVRCPTELQPYHGTLAEGVVAHLAVVHDVILPLAAQLAAKLLADPRDFTTAGWTL